MPVVRKILERSAGRYALRRISDGGVVDLSAHGAYVLSGRRLEDYFARRYDGWRIREIDYAEVLRENAYLSRTIEVQAEQRVVDTGLYGIVRHPMYSATLLLFLAMPIVLGSPFSFVIMLCYLPIIAKRIRNEEVVLADGLEGYDEYMERVKWRLIPHIW